MVPLGQGLKRLFIGHIADQKHSVSISEIEGSNGPKLLLAGSVPNLQLIVEAVAVVFLGEKHRPDCRLGELVDCMGDILL